VHTEHVLNEIMDFLAHRLSEEECKRVADHLAHCPRCANEYQTLLVTHAALQRSQRVDPKKIYFSTILPRVRERLVAPPQSLGDKSAATLQIAMPLAVFLFLVMLLLRMPPDVSSETAQLEALHQEVSEYNDEEILQAVEHANTSALFTPATELAAANIAEHLPGDPFLRSAVSKQMESNEIADIDMENMISELNPEQIDQILSGLSERKTL
jgi:hypothetical protein